MERIIPTKSHCVLARNRSFPVAPITAKTTHATDRQTNVFATAGLFLSAISNPTHLLPRANHPYLNSTPPVKLPENYQIANYYQQDSHQQSHPAAIFVLQFLHHHHVLALIHHHQDQNERRDKN